MGFAFFIVSFTSLLTAAPVSFTIIHSTDIHGWINGHPHQPELDATFADLYNFAYHMKKKASTSENVLFFDSGDMTQGSGLSDATEIQGQFIYEMARYLPYDAITIGNHEMYNESTLDNIADNVTPFWGGRVVCSNVEYIDSSKLLASKYRIITLPNGQGKVLVFGFLWSMKAYAGNAIVTPIDEIVEDAVLNRVLSETDATVIICPVHIGTSSGEVTRLRKWLKAKKPTTPLVLLTGHSHKVRTDHPSEDVYAMESGCYHEHIGILKFTIDPAIISSSSTSSSSSSSSSTFQSSMFTLPDADSFFVNFTVTTLNASRSSLQSFAKVSQSEWPTQTGTAISGYIASKVRELNLTGVVGCLPYTFSSGRNETPGAHSLWSLMVDEAYPLAIPPAKEGMKNIFVQSELFRTSLYKGTVTRDDLYTVIPYHIYTLYVAKVPAEHMEKLMETTDPDLPLANSEAMGGGEIPDEMKRAIKTYRIFREAEENTTRKAFPQSNKGDFHKYFQISQKEFPPTHTYTIYGSEMDMANIFSRFNQFAPFKYWPKTYPLFTRDVLGEVVEKKYKCNVDGFDSIQPQQQSQTASSSSSSPLSPLSIILIVTLTVIGAIGLVGALLLFIFHRRRKDNPETQPLLY